jgi:hypothetical protein
MNGAEGYSYPAERVAMVLHELDRRRLTLTEFPILLPLITARLTVR